MVWRKCELTASALLIFSGWLATARAGEAVQLGTDPTANIVTLEGNGTVDTVPAYYRHGGWGNFHRGWGGFNRGWSGFRGWGSFYRPYYFGHRFFYPRYFYSRYAYYSPFYSYYSPYDSSYYSPGFYSYPYSSYSYSYALPAFNYVPAYQYCPNGSGFYQMPHSTVLDLSQSGEPSYYSMPQQGRQPMPRATDGTYPYDGGPRERVPMPRRRPDPINAPPKAEPLKGRVVSLVSEPAKRFAYRAYGDKDVPAQSPVRIARLKAE